jgi:hypothetical protein
MIRTVTRIAARGHRDWIRKTPRARKKFSPRIIRGRKKRINKNIKIIKLRNTKRNLNFKQRSPIMILNYGGKGRRGQCWTGEDL